MNKAHQFTFGPFQLDTERSRVTFSYSTDLMTGGREEYVDTLELPSATKEMWESLPEQLVRSLLESLSLMYGLNYWKIHCAPKMRIQGFSLSQEQAEFWNTVYTKGLGEFFFRTQTDFRGLISFPYKSAGEGPEPTSLKTRTVSLLLNGGGKDSVVSAELLKECGKPFCLFEFNSVDMQRKLAERIGGPVIEVRRRTDSKLAKLQREKKLVSAYPSILTIVFTAALAAALRGYRYVVTSNESSADEGNLMYLGLDVNHQWSKSTESERLVNEYLARFVTPDIHTFSLLRQFTELENTRRFVRYPAYFKAFSSCNMNFRMSEQVMKARALGRSYWCGTCPKCAFIFASLSAFLPKETVVEIFGANLYAREPLLPVFRRLLGIESFKPFECVGSPEEMIVAMHGAVETGSYDTDPAIQMYKRHFDLSQSSFEQMTQRVFSSAQVNSIPEELKHSRLS